MSRVHQSTFQKHNLHFEITHRIPSCIHPAYWVRHALSLRDIQTIVSFVPAQYIWLVAYVNQIECPWFALRPTVSSDDYMTVSAKSTAMRLLLMRYHPDQQVCISNKLNITSPESLSHIPPIPSYILDHSTFSKLRMCISPPLVPRCLLDLDSIPTVPFVLVYMDKCWLPVAFEGPAICCTCIVDEQSYLYTIPFTCPTGDSYAHAPMVCIHDNVTYCLTDESILFTA